MFPRSSDNTPKLDAQSRPKTESPRRRGRGSACGAALPREAGVGQLGGAEEAAAGDGLVRPEVLAVPVGEEKVRPIALRHVAMIPGVMVVGVIVVEHPPRRRIIDDGQGGELAGSLVTGGVDEAAVPVPVAVDGVVRVVADVVRPADGAVQAVRAVGRLGWNMADMRLRL